MITAKEIAEKLGLSATAVSMALNNKPGVSTETRKKIIRYAEENGYDFSKLSLKRCRSGKLPTICCMPALAWAMIFWAGSTFRLITPSQPKNTQATKKVKQD